MTGYPFYSNRQADALRMAQAIGTTGTRTLPADWLGVLIVGIDVEFWGRFEAGHVVDVCGDRLRFNNGQLVIHSVNYYNIIVNALELVEPYTPPVREMVVSPFTGQLVPVDMYPAAMIAENDAIRLARQAELQEMGK